MPHAPATRARAIAPAAVPGAPGGRPRRIVVGASRMAFQGVRAAAVATSAAGAGPGCDAGGGGRGTAPAARVDYGSMRMPNTMVADWPGASVPTVAVMVPAAPLAGAEMVPTVVEAGIAAE